MVQRSVEEILQTMESINWDFEDYNSIKYPLDINSIPWYPATFPAPIPKYLVALLSESGDMIFDPFGGKGTTAIEALKQRRKFIYNDINPYAVSIVESLLSTVVNSNDEAFLSRMVNQDRDKLSKIIKPTNHLSYMGKDEESIYSKLPSDIKEQLKQRNIREDVVFWFHCETLEELIKIYDHICTFNHDQQTIRKLSFVSILKDVCSQRGHFSYITDNCRPSEMRYYNAIDAYSNMFDRIQRACVDFIRQYKIINKTDDIQDIRNQCVLHSGNAKDCSYIADNSVDLIITSPPYLCAQDYVLTMRLHDFFFPNDGFSSLPKQEIGPRRMRSNKGIVDSYFSDMKIVLGELYRVLKQNSYLCLIIGQGNGKVSKGIDILDHVIHMAVELGLAQLFRKTRLIGSRYNRVGGVETEDVILFCKKA